MSTTESRRPYACPDFIQGAGSGRLSVTYYSLWCIKTGLVSQSKEQLHVLHLICHFLFTLLLTFYPWPISASTSGGM